VTAQKKAPNRVDIYKASTARCRKMSFGDPITNICAGENNPLRWCYFVKLSTVRKVRYVQCTDKMGKFWDVGMEVIHPGHIFYDKCTELFEPVWESQYGKAK
jgi:hypothetical protein